MSCVFHYNLKTLRFVMIANKSVFLEFSQEQGEWSSVVVDGQLE